MQTVAEIMINEEGTLLVKLNLFANYSKLYESSGSSMEDVVQFLGKLDVAMLSESHRQYVALRLHIWK